MTVSHLKGLQAASDNLAKASRNLWEAHCKSHDAIRQPERGPIDPRKYGMNYGELVALKEALDAYDNFVLQSVLRES